MTKPYALVVFDWEGTLGDALGQILHIVAAVAQHLNLPQPDPNKIMACAGFSLVTAIQKLYPTLNTEQQQAVLNEVQMSLMQRHDETYLFPGAAQMIASLHAGGIDLAIATNKGERSLQRALEQTNLQSFFLITRAAGQAALKPDPQMLEEILEYTGHAAMDTLMVGDSSSDIEMAKRLSIDAIAVDFYGQHQEQLLNSGALAVFRHYDDVIAFIKHRSA